VTTRKNEHREHRSISPLEKSLAAKADATQKHGHGEGSRSVREVTIMLRRDVRSRRLHPLLDNPMTLTKSGCCALYTNCVEQRTPSRCAASCALEAQPAVQPNRETKSTVPIFSQRKSKRASRLSWLGTTFSALINASKTQFQASRILMRNQPAKDLSISTTHL
jgi:hypothetical protein